jgi:FecR-like protein
LNQREEIRSGQWCEMAKIPLLISRYLDGELANDEIAELAAALQTDASSIDRLVFAGLIHAQLLNWMDQQYEAPEGATAPDDDRQTGLAPWSPVKSPVASAGNPSGRYRIRISSARRRLFSWSTLAATLLIATGLLSVAYLAMSRPVHVGQLTEATDCRWGASSVEMREGAFVSTGQDVELVLGRAIITFATGAKLLVEGPTTLHFESASHVQLIHGRIAAKVPRQAVGFTVSSSLARIVDLGTQFSLSLNADKSFDLHVFEGLVELQLDKRFGEAVHKPVYVSAIHAVNFDVRDGDIKAVEFESGKNMPF